MFSAEQTGTWSAGLLLDERLDGPGEQVAQLGDRAARVGDLERGCRLAGQRRPDGDRRGRRHAQDEALFVDALPDDRDRRLNDEILEAEHVVVGAVGPRGLEQSIEGLEHDLGQFGPDLRVGAVDQVGHDGPFE